MPSPLHRPITRRSAATALLGGCLGLTPLRSPRRRARAAGPAVLGADRAAFDQALGNGLVTANGLVQYGTATATTPSHLVRFGPSGAIFVESDYSQHPLGGREQEDAEVGTSAFLPSDAVKSVSVRMGGSMLMKSRYTVTAFTSETAATATGRSGNILLLDETMTPDDFTYPGEAVYPRKDISLERPDVVPITPNGNQATIGATLETWEQVYGPIHPAQTGWIMTTEGIGSITLIKSSVDGPVEELDFYPDIVLSLNDAAQFIGSALPSGTELVQTHWFDPTASGPIGIRAQMWHMPTGQYVANIMYVEGPELGGNVRRVILSARLSA